MEDYVQESQQATQLATQPDLPGPASTYQAIDSNAYATFHPCSAVAGLTRIDLLRNKLRYTVGRGHNNDIRFPGLKISFHHCVLEWDGRDDENAVFTVHDTSTNGTWWQINGERVKKGHTKVLRDGNEVAFGTPMEQANKTEDYRYIFRVLTGNRRTRGINAEYDITHELGKGSFATVMKAVHRPTGRFYAVKIIHGSKIRGNDETKVNAFKREILILESLHHPNICRLKEQFHEDGDENIYLVLELVEGGDLLDFIVTRDGLPENLSKHIARQICEALAYIHSKGITHRDLKPENILLTKDNPPVAKVADFGLAKVVDQLTMLRTMCGTPSYLAPEVVNTPPGGGYDQKVDSFSVGVIVYSMIANSAPFFENDLLEIRQRIAERSVDWNSLRRKGTSPESFDFIKKLLDTNPASRMSLTDALGHPWLIN
ncbi:kinase-like domain-containing protein, partial [Vararia minispora EC-137]